MSQIPGFPFPTQFGGFGFGLNQSAQAVLDISKSAPKPTDKAEAEDPIERASTLPIVGRGTYPGFDAAPPFSYFIAWQMRRFSTIVLAHTVVTAPAIAGQQTIEIINKQADQGLAERIKEAAEEDILPTVMDWLPGMFEDLHFGHFLQEVEWGSVNGRTVPIGFHSILPGEAVLFRDAYRRLVGFEVAGQYRDARYALLSVNQPHIDPIFGYSRNENCREEWWRIRQSEANADKTERKASGIQMGIGLPMGASFVDATGKPLFGKELGQAMMNAAVQGQTFSYPLTPFEKKDIVQNPALADIPAVKIEKFDWGNIGPALEAHLARGRDLKTDIMRAWHRPEREAMQGQHGTNAESETQGDIGTTDTELVAAQAMRQFSRQVMDRWAVTNFGPEAAGIVAIVQSPLSDPQQAFLQKFAQAIASDTATGPDFLLEIDKRDMAERIELPLRDEADVDADRQKIVDDKAMADKAKLDAMRQPVNEQQNGENQSVPVKIAASADGHNGHRTSIPSRGEMQLAKAAARREVDKRLSRLLLSGDRGMALSADDADGHWVTIDGVHVFINGEGAIIRGPKSMMGKKLSELEGKKKVIHHREMNDSEKPPAKGGGSGGSNRTKEQTQTPLTKSEIAKQNASYTGKEVQRYSEEHNEPALAKSVKGLSYRDNEPVDVVSGENGVIEHGMELKTMVSNKASKLTMDSYSQVRKVNWEKANDATFHTIVFDDREVFNANGIGNHDPSGRVYYYRRGIAGSARVATMEKATSMARVKQLMAMPESELPAGAQRSDGHLRAGRWKAFQDSTGKGFKNSVSGKVFREKK